MSRHSQWLQSFDRRSSIDTSRRQLFAAVGRVKSPFKGMNDWPELDSEFEAVSKRALDEKGHEHWLEIGGIEIGGTLGLKPNSIGAEEVISRIEAEYGGVVWCDPQNDWWGTRLLRGSGDQRFGISIPYDGGIFGSMHLYRRAEAILWILHDQVMQQRRSLVTIPDQLLAEVIWPDSRPKDWRRELKLTLLSLQQLRLQIVELSRSGWQPRLDTSSILVDHVSGLAGGRTPCDESCPFWQTDLRHSHYKIGIGHGFLGALESFGQAKAGLRIYDFNFKKCNKETKSAKEPAYPFISALTSGNMQFLSKDCRTLLRALVREVEYAGNGPKHQIGNHVPNASGTIEIECPLLAPGINRMSFNGNGMRRGCGYNLVGRTNKGWLSKLGLQSGNQTQCSVAKIFFGAIEELQEPFEILAIGYSHRDDRWLSLEEMRAELKCKSGFDRLRTLNVRIYGRHDFFDVFRSIVTAQFGMAEDNLISDQELSRRLRASGQSAGSMADILGVSKAFASQLLNNRKKWPISCREVGEEVLMTSAIRS